MQVDIDYAIRLISDYRVWNGINRCNDAIAFYGFEQLVMLGNARRLTPRWYFVFGIDAIVEKHLCDFPDHVINHLRTRKIKLVERRKSQITAQEKRKKYINQPCKKFCLTTRNRQSLETNGYRKGIERNRANRRWWIKLSWQTKRERLLEKYGFVCIYCGKEIEQRSSAHIDHVHPKSKGGGDALDNLVVSCAACNLRKGNKTPEDAGIKRPFTPS